MSAHDHTEHDPMNKYEAIAATHDRGLVIDCIAAPTVTIYLPDGRQGFWRGNPTEGETDD